MLRKIYYITEELNNNTWKLEHLKGHNFEEKLYETLCLWCERNQIPAQIYQTEKTNDNGKDIIIETHSELINLFGMDFPLNSSGSLKMYIECKSSDSYKIAYNNLSGNLKLSKDNGIDYYILVINNSIYK